MRLALSLALALTPALLACDDTEECIELKKVKKQAERALRAAKGRAALSGRTGQSLERIKRSTEAKLAEHGLDLPEEKVRAALEARVEKIEGAKLERTTRPVAPDPHSGPSLEAQSETLFRITFPARGLEAAWEKARAIFGPSPLTRLFALLPPDARGGDWRLELGRPNIQRLPMDIEPRPLPHRPSADDVEEAFGFCGASELRAEIAALEKEIEKHAEEAGQTTMNLPLSASWRGLSRRADLSIETELESRRIAGELVEAVLAAKQKLAALGVERESVLLEIEGGPKQLAKVQTKLDESLLRAMQKMEGGREGVARMAIGNRVAAAGRRPDSAETEVRSPPKPLGGPGAKGGE